MQKVKKYQVKVWRIKCHFTSLVDWNSIAQFANCIIPINEYNNL
jgi:hypothetical protein